MALDRKPPYPTLIRSCLALRAACLLPFGPGEPLLETKDDGTDRKSSDSQSRSGDTARDIEEGERMLALRRRRDFKLKIRDHGLADDVAHIPVITHASEGRASVRVDVNQAWDKPTAAGYLPALCEAGVVITEQPVAGWNVPAMAWLQRADPRLATMGDEGVATLQDALRHVAETACYAVTLKLTKYGGVAATRSVTAVAQAAGPGLHGSTMLEGTIGTDFDEDKLEHFRTDRSRTLLPVRSSKPHEETRHAMLYHVAIEVNLPPDMPAAEAHDIKAREKAYAQDLMRQGKWPHIWHVAGRSANVSIFDVANNDELHALLSGLPLFPWMDIEVTALARHPSAI